MKARSRVRPLAMAGVGALLHLSLPAHAAQPPDPAAEPGADTAAPLQTAPQPAVNELAPIEVISSRLRDARIDLSPAVGTTVYSIDSKTFSGLSEGSASSFDEVLLHLPGVSKDSKASGALHVRDDHGNVQYRVNGVQLPESISGFGTAIDTRFVDHVDFLTGALPAQYGLHTAGVIEIQTREGKITPGGEVDLQLGSHGTVQPSAQAFGSAGSVTWYLSGSGLDSEQGIENPQPTASALHDQTRQQRVFGNLSWFIDDQTRAALMFGGYHGRFQIPDNPGKAPAWSLAGVSNAATGFSVLPSARLDEQQAEDNRFVALSLEQTLDSLDYQLSAFHQGSSLHYLPDPVGDLVYSGAAGDLLRSGSSNGVQADASWKASSVHIVRFGGAWTAQLTASSNRVSVFPVDAQGMQTALVPELRVDASNLLGTEASAYLQDEWHADDSLTVNYGVRYDRVTAYIDEQQWSPRLNLAWKWQPDTLLHAGFSRYFTPPPQELAAQRSIALFSGTSSAPLSAVSDNVRAERSSYWDIGVAHTVDHDLTIAVDAYLKDIDHLLDEGQFGQALILSPFNYAHGRAEGVELGLTWNHLQWSAYGNLAWQKAQAHHIESGQALFAVNELAYIASHDIYLDHDQTWTASAGSAVHLGPWQFSADAVLGSGLRNTAPGGAPNGEHLPGYALLNLGLSREWKLGGSQVVEGRLSLVNLFDRSYLLRDGTGVGVGAPQYGLRRSAFASAAWRF
ncbi:MAG: TonB-dependent receptor [Pseudomonadota bacterium]|nr:TonB-dependent receptor [Pseudomonadota bacterium]